MSRVAARDILAVLKAFPLASGAEWAMKKLLRRVFTDRRGDDLIEYALLAAFLALATLLAFQLMGTRMKDAFESWDTGVQDRWDLNADLTPANSGS